MCLYSYIIQSLVGLLYPIMPSQALLIAIFVTVVVLLAWWYGTKEDFETKREKATAIREWFNQNSNPQYNTYKVHVPESDIVEYDKIRALYTAGSTPAIADVEEQL